MKIIKYGYQYSRKSLIMFTIKNYKKCNTLHYDDPSTYVFLRKFEGAYISIN